MINVNCVFEQQIKYFLYLQKSVRWAPTIDFKATTYILKKCPLILFLSVWISISNLCWKTMSMLDRWLHSLPHAIPEFAKTTYWKLKDVTQCSKWNNVFLDIGLSQKYQPRPKPFFTQCKCAQMEVGEALQGLQWI